ncbi:MAG TPA: DHH family phosphoesterase [Candidatus Saccharimonadales bacterium]|nr:DHH family phosphoesterase [Candidatus Saccharimonadales bacterium]
MQTYPVAAQINQLITNSSSILIVQADNPDADSLGSSLAMEQILLSLGKETYLYCGVDMPTYLRYMEGWDRVTSELPNKFDASIIVDASTMTLFEKLSASGQRGWLAAKPCLILDHHEIVENKVPFATILVNDHHRSSTGELIYLLAKQLNWTMNQKCQSFLMSSILGDTQGLTNQLASATTYKIMAEMVEAGIDRPALEDIRREYSKMPLEIFRYKADLIKKTEFYHQNRLAIVVVPQAEINAFSPLYNPAPLIQGDMLQTKAVAMALVIKRYADGKVTGAIRCNPSAPVGAILADQFGGGGHRFASGFKIDKVEDFNKLKTDIIKAAGVLLSNRQTEV